MEIIKAIRSATQIMEKNVVAYRAVQSPLGMIRITASNKGITGVNWVSDEFPQSEFEFDAALEAQDSEESQSAVRFAEQAVCELNEYFRGTRREFGVPVVLQGTRFQISVWEALQHIPYGQTCSYREIAQSIGSDKAVRAVGQANRRNPVAILLPCHRVIGASGALVGYAGSNVGLKAELLSLEQGRILTA